MGKTKLKRNMEAEREKLTALLDKAAPEKREALRGLIPHLAFTKAKLDEAKVMYEAELLVMNYDNGGGQKGIRENPKMKAYANLFKLYLEGTKEFLRALPAEESQAAEEQIISPLQQILERRRAAAAE